MSTHRDPRTRRAHRLAAVAGGLPPGLAAAEADPDEPRTEAQKDWDAITPRTQDQLNAAVRLELGLDDWRTQARTEHQLDDADADRAAPLDLGPGWPPDYPEVAPAVNLPAEGASSGLPAAELTVNLPADWSQLPCTCHPSSACLDSCPACAHMPEDVACPAVAASALAASAEDAAEWRAADADDLEHDGRAAGVAVPEPGPAPAASSSSVPTVGGRVLAWASRHDARSLEFLVRDRLAQRVPIQDRGWEHGPALDQGTVPPLSLHDGSSCTGHMAVNLRNMLELMAAPPTARPGDVDLLGHQEAVAIYDQAQQLDEWPGDDYPGTSVLAMMKAGQAAGWWSTYLWAKGTRDIAQAILQVGPVGIGVPLTQGMVTPDADGIVTATGAQLGGHAMAVWALRRTVGGRPGPWFGLLQSYGDGVGHHGELWIHHADLAHLLAGVGEAAIPLLGTGGQL
jgi:hypothetical protein